MQYVGKLMSSVYNTITPNINPSTLTGAIDVIVVERDVVVEETTTQPDGSTATQKRTTTEMASTPFHVRFGKMSVLRPDERKVTLHLNDSPDPLPYAMKVGENGEAFFVIKVENPDEPVPDALVTSPVMSPTPGTGEPVPLRLDESHAEPPAPEAAPVELDLDIEGYKFSNSNSQVALKQGQKFANELPLNRQHGGNNPLVLSERLDHHNLRWQHQFLGSVSKLMAVTPGPDKPKTPPARSRRMSDSYSEAVPERPRLAASLSDSDLYARRGADAATEAVASEVTEQPDMEDEVAGTLTCAPADPYLFQLRVDDNTVYSFELSLCSLPAQDQEAEYVFDEGRVSFQRFLEDASIVRDPRLCIRHNDAYHYRERESDMFTTLAYYRDVLVQNGTPVPKSSAWSRFWRRPAASSDAATPTEAPAPAPAARPETYVKTLRLSSDQLKQLGLQKGVNTLTFSVTSSYSGVATCRARVFLWDCDKPVVVSDIDGTITKSDALGHVFTLMGRDWTHLGVAKLYHDIAKNGYRLMYLTSRAIGQADITRDYLRGINQNNYQLPDGPVIMSPDRLIASLHREVILRKPEVFKMACLRDIARLFGDDPSQPDHKTPFYAGFGNRITDALSYRSVNIPSSRIFTIDSNGEVKMELLELAGYHTSYPNMTDLVDQMFPPVPSMRRNEHIAAYTDFNYWRDDGHASDIALPPDEELVPVTLPSSPPQRGVRSPKSPASSIGSPSSPPLPPRDDATERPSRIRRLLGLSGRQRSKPLDPAPDAPATSPPPAPPSEPSSLAALDEQDMSPEERQRDRRRQQLLYGTSSFSRNDAKQEADEDPLLEAGDIQFEWRG